MPYTPKQCQAFRCQAWTRAADALGLESALQERGNPEANDRAQKEGGRGLRATGPRDSVCKEGPGYQKSSFKNNNHDSRKGILNNEGKNLPERVFQMTMTTDQKQGARRI